MTRRRVNLALVPNESARKTTFKKRKTGLMKKMDEITTLCGINGCLVIFNPKDAEPHVWPSKEKAMELLSKYERMPKMEQQVKKVDHEKFMTERVVRLREHVAKREKRNKEIRASMLMQQMTQGRKMEELNIEEVELLIWFSDMKLKAINRQNILLPPIKTTTSLSAAMPPPPPPPINTPTSLTAAMPPPPPPPASRPPPLMVQPPPVEGQGMFDSEQSFQVDYDLSFMNMFGYESADAGANGLWPGDQGTGNGDYNFRSGFEPGSSSSFSGFH